MEIHREWSFSVKSFYNFLNDGGLRCPVAKFFWRNFCPRKINLFNWLAWKNRILTLENLAIRRCNNLPTATCVLCHSATETIDHLFLQCPFTTHLWDYFVNLLQLPVQPSSMEALWVSWRALLTPASRILGDLVVKALMWNVWLARNDCLFNANVLHVYSVILKIDRMILSWCSSVGDRSQEKMLDSLASIRRSLEFLGPRVEERLEVSVPEEFQEQSVG